MQFTHLRPKKRSKLRLALGRTYYTNKRRLKWLKDRKLYTKKQVETPLDHLVFSHKTPLFRGLKAVDRWVDENKIINISQALKKINGIVLEPGDHFSYWQLIGRPTAKKGYVKGMVLDHGKFKYDIGGGLCQLSNMIFWMIIHSPLDVTERHRHSYDVFPDVKRSQPFGSGATCVYNYRDLQFENNSNEPYQLFFRLTDSHLEGAVLSTREPYLEYEVYEKDHYMTLEHWGGYLRHNKIHRRVCDLEGHEIMDEYICENHCLMMYAPLLENKDDIRSS